MNAGIEDELAKKDEVTVSTEPNESGLKMYNEMLISF